MSRHAAARGRADSCQPEVIRAIKLLKLKHKPLNRSGDGIEDVLVLIPSVRHTLIPRNEAAREVENPQVNMPPHWLFVECKVPRNKAGTITESQYMPAQKAWRAETPDGPRITVTGFEDALKQLRTLMGK